MCWSSHPLTGIQIYLSCTCGLLLCEGVALEGVGVPLKRLLFSASQSEGEGEVYEVILPQFHS